MARIFVANRGEVAVRVIAACRRLGHECVVPYSKADEGSLPTRLADRAVCIGPALSRDSYLNQVSLISAATGTGCDAVHPGYGFLSESAEFADNCIANGLVFIGPSPEVLRAMGDKSTARAIAAEAGLPVLPGTGPIEDLGDVDLDALGEPLLIKAVAGGGGRGIRLVTSSRDLANAFDISRREAQASFGDGRLYLERYVRRARHVEVQILADGHGKVLHLGERECSVQRRHQKILEEAPALIDPQTRSRLWEYAVALAEHLGYANAGTVEFILDDDTHDLWFIEMNPRLQVEHGVTEMVYQVDVVAHQINVAFGGMLAFEQGDLVPSGHAIEWRITAEDVASGFIPRPGTITRWEAPVAPGIRLDTHCHVGYPVPPFYDSMLGKLIAYGPTRDLAVERLGRASAMFGVDGIPTTLSLCAALSQDDEFRAGGVTTTWLDAALPGLISTGASRDT